MEELKNKDLFLINKENGKVKIELIECTAIKADDGITFTSSTGLVIKTENSMNIPRYSYVEDNQGRGYKYMPDNDRFTQWIMENVPDSTSIAAFDSKYFQYGWACGWNWYGYKLYY